LVCSLCEATHADHLRRPVRTNLLIAFAVFIAVPRLPRHALAAVVAPAAFGFWALVGHVTWVLVCMFVLKVQLKPLEGLHGVLNVLFFFIMPGALGSWM
jgi:hypothetical protein